MRCVMTISAVLILASAHAAAEGDTPPDAALAAVQGEWEGKLQYRDYSEPDKFVTLPTRLFVALGAPNELVLQFTYDDGPGKTVHSYDRMTFDSAAKSVTWVSHGDDEGPRVHTITADSADGETRQVIFERQDGDHRAQYTLALSPRDFQLSKIEIATDGGMTYRNRYDFVRPAQSAAAAGCSITHTAGGIYGNDSLHAVLPANGTFVFVPGGAGFTDRDGALGIKFGWFRHKAGTLYVGGRRLDGEAARARAYISDGYGDEGFQTTYMVFPTPGCWEITGGVGEARLSFVLRVEKIGAGPPSWYPFPAPGRRATSNPAGDS